MQELYKQLQFPTRIIIENTFKISCVIDTTDPTIPLGIEIWLDDLQIFNQNWVNEFCTINYELPDLDAEHELRFVMKNKTVDHTNVDESGAIVKDACLVISDLAFDEILLGNIVTEKAVYTHDFNGTGKVIENKFFGEMGCNGVVSLKFTTPMYLWLLENM
jgi:hypothetical protein